MIPLCDICNVLYIIHIGKKKQGLEKDQGLEKIHDTINNVDDIANPCFDNENPEPFYFDTAMDPWIRFVEKKGSESDLKYKKYQLFS